MCGISFNPVKKLITEIYAFLNTLLLRHIFYGSLSEAIEIFSKGQGQKISCNPDLEKSSRNTSIAPNPSEKH